MVSAACSKTTSPGCEVARKQTRQMSKSPFELNFNPEIGVATEVQNGLRRLVAPNASPMTFRGTNTYFFGEAEIAVIDPGPDDEAHLAAILATVGDVRKVSHIFVTHSHLDHSPLARRLSQICDAPVLARGDSWAGQSDRMKTLAQTTQLGGGEGIDVDFAPDIALKDGDFVEGREWVLNAITTPGHISNHLCFADEATGTVFSGDHVMGWATTLVSPPDGDLTMFMASLEKMLARDKDQNYFPGHGEVLSNPQAMIAYQISHRKNRENQILEVLSEGEATPTEIARRIYAELDPRLLPAAERNVFAHLLDLSDRGKAVHSSSLSLSLIHI